jgi:hypothetical protein
MRKSEQLAHQGKESERHREMPRSSPAVADECIFDIFELAEDAIEERGDFPSGQVVDALRYEADDALGSRGYSGGGQSAVSNELGCLEGVGKDGGD